MMIQFSFFIAITFWASSILSQNFEPFVNEIGGTFCKFLAFKGILHRKYFNLCPQPTCAWDDWNHALKSTNTTSLTTKKRYILSFGHNGFGNQLWEHSTAFNIAESLKGQLYIAAIPDNLSPGGVMPPNTWTGMGAMERLLPPQFLYENLPVDSEIRKVCDNEPFVVADRPVDWRDKNYSSNFRQNLMNLITDKNPRCLKLVGYFQNMPLCVDDTRRLWTTGLVANFTMRPGDNDISIYLRCVPRHYHFNGVHFYENILNHTSFDRVWLFQAPECPTKLGADPSKDGVIAAVVRLLVEKYNATRWPGFQGTDDVSFLLHDLSGLIQSKKLILPVSSWAYWAGFFSKATEIHVNAPPRHELMYTSPQYVYHDESKFKYFGRYNATENDIVYGQKLINNKEAHNNKHAAKKHAVHHQVGAGTAVGGAAGDTVHGKQHTTIPSTTTGTAINETSTVLSPTVISNTNNTTDGVSTSTTPPIETTSINKPVETNNNATQISNTTAFNSTGVSIADLFQPLTCVCGSQCTLSGRTFDVTTELYKSMCPTPK